jgi:hypothetical protein
MGSTLTVGSSGRPTDRVPATSWDDLVDKVRSGAQPVHEDLDPDLLDDLDDPNLVLSPGYVGPDRRGLGLGARLRRATFAPRRSVLRVELAVVALAVAVTVASVLLVGSSSTGLAHARKSPQAALAPASAATPTTAPPPSAATPTTAPPPSTTTPTTAPPPAPPANASAAGAAPGTTPPAAAAALTPAQLGAQALALVRYPWQSIPGYSIQFLSISDAPSSGFYGNTTFTWGRAGGQSVLYVYPGETVQRLAAITAFEIGHEVDAAAVQPQGGEAQIEDILGIHPASWSPNCDCAEQGFLSGWYAAAFSNYWSPGVGNWSQIAPEPSGATLTAVEPWLNPAIH